MVNKVTSLYESGKSITEISKFLGISRTQCYRIANKEGLRLDGRQYRCNDMFFSTYTPEACYWAGFIASDGCVYKNLIKVSLSLKDYNHLVLLKKAVDFTGPVKVYKNCSTISITSKQIIADLFSNFNITTTKTFTLQPPPNNIPKDMIRHYIRGYIDGDGCIFVSDNTKSVSIVGTKHIIEWIKDILKMGLLIGNPKINQVGKVYSISFNGKRQFDSIVRFIYNGSTDSTRLFRKYNLALSKSPDVISKEQLEEKVVDLYRNGKSINYIIRNTEFGYYRIYRILSEHGMEILKTNKKILSKEVKDNILELRRNGTKIKVISKLTGVSNPKISELLREFSK